MNSSKLLLCAMLWLLTSMTLHAANIIPVRMPEELPVSVENPYVLDLDQSVTTPNGNQLFQDHALHFDLGMPVDTGDELFVRVALSKEVLWGVSNLVLLFEEGNQPNLVDGVQDLNDNGVLEVLEVGFLTETAIADIGILNQNIATFLLKLPNSITADAQLLLATTRSDYAIDDGRVINTAGHPTLRIIDTTRDASISFSVHKTQADAGIGSNALTLDGGVLLINFIPQFDSAITSPAISTLDPLTIPANSTFIEEGEPNDALTGGSDTDTDLSTASYVLINDEFLIDDPINLTAADFLQIDVIGDMTTVSNVFIEFDDSGIDVAGVQTAFDIELGRARVKIPGNLFPEVAREDHIAIQINQLPMITTHYAVNAQIGLVRNGITNIVFDEFEPDVFNFLTIESPILITKPSPDSVIEMVSEFATSVEQYITFTNQGDDTLFIKLNSLPKGEFSFVSNYVVELETQQSTQFRVQCTPSNYLGTELDLQFTTNSLNQELINYKLLCRTKSIPEPEIEILANDTLIGVGSEIHFGTILQSESSTIKFTIRNLGTATLNLENPVIPTGFSLGGIIPQQLAANGVTHFDLSLSGKMLGEFKSPLNLFNDDRDENPFQLILMGQVLPLAIVPSDAPPLTTDPAPTTSTTPPIISASSAPPTNATGDVIGATSNVGNTATDIYIQPGSSVSGGYLAGEINNHGLISNLTINPDAKLEGGKLSSVIYNSGTVCNATITNYSELIGGNVCDDIQNFGTLTDVNILEDSEVTGGYLNNIIFNEGKLCDVKLEDNTRIIGGQINCTLTGQARAPATIAQAEILENSELFNVCITPSVRFAEGVALRGNVKLPSSYVSPNIQDYCINPEQLVEYSANELLGTDPEAFSIFFDSDLQKIPPNAMQSLTPTQFSFIPDMTLDAMSKEQFEMIPIKSFSGLTDKNMVGFSGELIDLMTAEHVEMINQDAVAALTGWGTSKFLTNFDPELITLETAQKFLKPDWSMDENGLLTAPANTPINLATFRLPANFPEQIGIDYDFPNFTTGFGFAGRGEPILQQINAILTNNPQNIRSVRQREDGLIIVDSVDGTQRAFIANTYGLMQLGVEAETGVTLDEMTGRLNIITEAKQQFSFIPAPKNYFLLGDSIGEDSKAHCYQQGNVLLEIKQNNPVVVMFAPNVVDSSDDKGVYLAEETNERAIREGRVVFEDGTAQTIYPTVLHPETFMDLVKQIQGVESIVYNVDGSFNLVFFGQNYALLPTFNTSSQTLNAGERVAPNLTLNSDGSVAYKVQDDNLLLTTQIEISPL